MYLSNFVDQILLIPKIDEKIDPTFLERLTISKKLLDGTFSEG